MILAAGLLLGLLSSGGTLRVSLTPEETTRFQARTGYTIRPTTSPAALDAGGENAAAEKSGENAAESHSLYLIEEEGIIGSVWRSRDHWYGPALSRLYQRVSLLRHHTSAMLTLLSVMILSWLLRRWCLERLAAQSDVAAQRVAVMFRRNLHRQALRLSPEDIDEHSAQSALGLFTTQVDLVRQELADWITRLTRYPLEILCVFAIAWSIDSRLTIQWALPLLLCWVLIERTAARVAQTRRLTSDRLRTEMQSLSEQLLNARLVRGFGMEQVEHEEFLKRLDRTTIPTRDIFATEREAWWLRRITPLICAAMVLFLAWLLGMKLLNRHDEMTFAAAAVFVLCVVVLLRAAQQLLSLRTVRENIAVAADQLYRYLDRLPAVSQAVGAKFLQPLTRTLHFDAVTFRTPTQQVLLDRLTLKLDARKSYAVVSIDSLSAKAWTLLLPRFLEPQSGRVLYDGEDIAWATLESLRAEAVFVGGDDPPLRGTVLDNLRAGNSQYTLPQITEAAKLTHTHNFLVRLPQGYETVLTGRDDELEASQRFRLALARAVLRNPALLIIEEPTATFDEDTKQLLDDTYQRISANRTLIFLPTRLSTLKRVDQILLLQNGQLVAQGTQAELVNVSPLYRHWEYLHFNEFRRMDAGPARV